LLDNFLLIIAADFLTQFWWIIAIFFLNKTYREKIYQLINYIWHWNSFETSSENFTKSIKAFISSVRYHGTEMDDGIRHRRGMRVLYWRKKVDCLNLERNQRITIRSRKVKLSSSECLVSSNNFWMPTKFSLNQIYAL